MPRSCFLLLVALAQACAQSADLDHSAWNAIVAAYVTPSHRVDYARLKERAIGDLDACLARLAAPWPSGMSPEARKAASINAYNALTVRWVAGHYPLISIWRTSHPFTEARHVVDGRKVSLDEIEKGLRQLADPRIHAALVCAARACPPLRREAYTAARLDRQLDENAREWLDNRELNTFDRDSKSARVSSIFDWYRGDFEAGGHSLEDFFARFAPPGRRPAAGEKWKLRFLEYHWGLNDSSNLGAAYSPAQFKLDYLKNKL